MKGTVPLSLMLFSLFITSVVSIALHVIHITACVHIMPLTVNAPRNGLSWQVVLGNWCDAGCFHKEYED